MNDSDPALENCIDARLHGRDVDIPETVRTDFEQAMAAHQALQNLLDATTNDHPKRSDRLPPAVSDAYEIECELGRGGMGVVYLALQRSLNRHVALKVLRPGEHTFGPMLRRFLDEARHLAQLQHPNIVSIHEVGDAGGEPYFTMEYIDGESLAQHLARGALTPSRAVAILKDVAAAIQHAHRHGIIHRDLKPANVLIDRHGQVFVTDFGLARNISQNSDLTQSGELLGTPQYMAPEQARGQSSLIGETTDIHALGLLLFEMLAGKPAFAGQSPADVLVRLLHEDAPALRTIDRRLPRDLETICMKALQKFPSARYPNASALLEDLRRWETGEPLLARRTSWMTRAWRWSARHWKMASAVAATATLVTILAPRILDRSVPELISWGEEELRAGRPEFATEIFQRAWAKSEPGTRATIQELLAQSIRQIEDPATAVDIALRYVDLAPELSFGPHDFLIAQTLAMKAREATPNGYFEPSHTPPPPRELALRQLATKRLSIFLDGPRGTPEERAEAQKSLQAIERSLRPHLPNPRWSPESLAQLPSGPIDELLAQATNSDLSPWDRGKAYFAAGQQWEATDRWAEAARAYRDALAQMSKVFPFVSGVVSHAQVSEGPQVGAATAPESRLLSDVLDSLERVDPGQAPRATGGLRIAVDHSEWLQGVEACIRLTLCEPGRRDPNVGLPHNLSSSVPIGKEPRETRILPGKYQLRFVGTTKKWAPREGRSVDLLDISIADWPTEIEIRDAWIDLPPVRIRQLKEIVLTTPLSGELVNLSKTQWKWERIENAVKYEITLTQHTDIPHPTTSHFLTLRADNPQWALADLSDLQRQTVLQNWTPGILAGFRVQALDADGNRIGITLDERRFLIADSE